MNLRGLLSNRDSTPIIFIPGIMGSFSRELFPTAGDWSFGPAEYTYRPMIDALESMNYKEGENLFVAFYDWRKSNKDSAVNYLIPVINQAKEITGKHKVHLVCHSMGGLVARSYIQSDFYKFDIDKLIMIGTPNTGAINAYYFWEGGEIPYKQIKNNFFYHALWHGYVWYLRRKYGYKTKLHVLRDVFPSVGELMPSHYYGDYLFYEENGAKNFIKIKDMYDQNTLLNQLNKNQNLIYERRVNVYQIIGTKITTNAYICIDHEDTDINRWRDGKPSYTVTKDSGDGTVLDHSAAFLLGEKIYLEGDHSSLLESCHGDIAKILRRRIKGRGMKEKKSANAYSIIMENISNFSLTVDQNTWYLDDLLIYKDDELVLYKLDQRTFWLMMSIKKSKDLVLNIEPKTGETMTLSIEQKNQYKSYPMAKEIKSKEDVCLNL